MIVKTQYVTFDQELKLRSGATLGPITLAYETYGELNADKSNAILVLHALSGDAHVAGRHAASDTKPGSAFGSTALSALLWRMPLATHLS